VALEQRAQFGRVAVPDLPHQQVIVFHVVGEDSSRGKRLPATIKQGYQFRR
jgi:hypothetical protein